MLYFLDDLGRQLASAGHAQKKIGDISDLFRAAVGEQKYGRRYGLAKLCHGETRGIVLEECSCTYSATTFTFSTGVSGRMPCPRLKMWPLRPPARWRISWAQTRTCWRSEKSTTGSRFPCTAPQLPTTSHP